ncbi:MAG: hypothetical protein NVS3B1_22140 [Marmoricola sp.]
MVNVVNVALALGPGPGVLLSPRVPVNDFRVKAHIRLADLGTGVVVNIGTGGANPATVALDLTNPAPGVGIMVNGTPVGIPLTYAPVAPQADVWLTASKQGSALQATIWNGDPDQGGAEIVTSDFQLSAAQAASYSGATNAFTATATGGSATFPLSIDSLDVAPVAVADTTSLTAISPIDNSTESAPALSYGGGVPRSAGQDESVGDTSTSTPPGS